MGSQSEIRFKWLVHESCSADIQGELQGAGIELDDPPRPADPSELGDTDDPGFEPILVIAGAAALSLLARTVSRIVRDHRQGGVVIDVRHKELQIRQDVRGIDAGSVVVVRKDASRVFHSPDELDLSRILAGL